MNDAAVEKRLLEFIRTPRLGECDVHAIEKWADGAIQTLANGDIEATQTRLALILRLCRLVIRDSPEVNIKGIHRCDFRHNKRMRCHFPMPCPIHGGRSTGDLREHL